MMSDRLNGLQRTDYRYRKATYLKIPLSGTFELSPVCNFSCRMCYVRKTKKEVMQHDREIMTLTEWLQIAKEAREQGLLYLLLTGGEPFLWPDFWELYEALIHMGFLISINTNASLIDDTALERLKKIPPFRLNITLYGASDETYEALCGVKNVFTTVDYAINELQKAGISVKLNASLTPYNVKDMEKLIRYAEERNLILDTTTYMFPPVRRNADMIGTNDRFTAEEAAKYRMECYRLQRGEEQYQRFLEEIVKGYIEPLGLDEACIDLVDGKIRCRAGSAAFWITWDGWMTPCGMMLNPGVDIKQGSFQDNWKKLNYISEKMTLSGVCERCTNRKICHPCAAMAMTETGHASGIPKYLCRIAKEMKEIASCELLKIHQKTGEVISK